MERIKVAAAPSGSRAAVELGEIDDTGLTYGGGVAHLAGAATHQLIALLGNGYMDRDFHLVVAGVGLSNCRITRSGGAMRIEYLGTFTP